MEEEDVKSYFKSFGNTGKAYIDNRLKLIKIEATEKIGSASAVIITGIIVGVLLFFLLIFLSITAGFVFAHFTHSLAKGFAIVAGIYLILFIVFLVWGRQWMSKKIFDGITGFMMTDLNEKDYDNTTENL